jgi:ATP-binding cassette subfamily F protein uup
MGNPNVLILDEPTNDLDIVTLNVLETYLRQFKGCLIVVSHDRYFMDKVVDHILIFEGDGIIRDFPGNYTDYREWKSLQNQPEKGAENKESRNTKPDRVENKRKMSFKERREYESLETEISAFETEKATLENVLNSGTTDAQLLISHSQRIAELMDLIDEKSMRWLELSEIEHGQ